MTLFPKEYRSIVGASAFAVLSVSISGGFLWKALESRRIAMEELKKRSDELSRLRSATPTPSEEHFKQFEEQLAKAQLGGETLRKTIQGMTIPLEKGTPQKFQTDISEKSKALVEKAEKFKVQGVAPGFYMDFDQYIKKLPSEETVPAVNRQLVAAELLINAFLDSKPLELKLFKIKQAETPVPAPAPKADPKTPGKPAPAPAAPILAAQTFDIQFSARPESMRSFLNAISRENRAFFVVRRIKIVNSNPEPPKRDAGTAPVAPVAEPQAKTAKQGREFILGKEHVEVEMRVDLISALPVPEPKEKEEKGAKQASQGGQK